MAFDRRSSGDSSSSSGSGESVGVGKRSRTESLQRKARLSVGAANDSHEAEADTVAAQVTSALAGGDAPSSPIAVTPVADTAAQGKDADGSGPVPDSVHAAVESSGTPLDAGVQRDMGHAFGGHDFSDVRVHTDSAAASSAADIGAVAYTVGSDVFFGDGAYQPSSEAGQSLLAHELTHTVQQRGSTLAQTKRIQRQQVPPQGGGGPPAGPQGGDPDEKTDAEGNKYKQASGKTYLTAAPGTPVPNHSGKFQALPANPHMQYATLMAQVIAAMATQLAYANGLKGPKLPPSNYRYWFAKVYHYVTKNEIQAINAGTYQYPMMKMQEVIWFQNAYKANCDAWDAGNQAAVEAHWRTAFAAAESKHSNDVSRVSTSLEHKNGAIGGAVGGFLLAGPLGAAVGAGAGYFGAKVVGDALTEGSRAVLSALLPSMQAHIRFDLPRAIAGCYNTYYAGIPTLSMGDFQPDFNAMGPVFDRAQAELNPEIQEACGITDPGTWAIAQSQFPKFFDIVKERSTTWTKAETIAMAQQRGLNNADTERVTRTVTGVGNPMSGASDYQVDGQDISGFDWNHNPGTAPPQTLGQ